MIGVTPVGVLTEIPAESRRFYREVLGIEKVQSIREIHTDDITGTLLRLESPQIEVFSTETRYVDRASQPVIRRDYFLQFRPKSMRELLAGLQKECVEVKADFRGNLRFQDINGLNWEIKVEFESNLQ
jgi:hypothetical protein